MSLSKGYIIYVETLKKQVENLLSLAGWNFSVETDSELSKISIFLHDEVIEKNLPQALGDLEQVIKVMAKKLGMEKVNVDLNNYKIERERLIVELAKAAARKVLAEKKEIELPVMNAYERRLVHVEIATRPDLKTESVGEGTQRHIVIKPI